MSTHNIGFYEDSTKIIFQLSSNIIKYAPYLFFCYDVLLNLHITKLEVSLIFLFCIEGLFIWLLIASSLIIEASATHSIGGATLVFSLVLHGNEGVNLTCDTTC